MEEAALVEKIRQAFGPAVAAGAGGFLDDAALLPEAAGARVVTADQMIEGRHFAGGVGTPADAGWRAVARNVSDLAAMGAEPVGFVWTLALPSRWLDEADALLDPFLAGAAECAQAYDLPLYGGDLARVDGPFVCSVTAFGDVASPLTRGGARVGDELWLSRLLGGAQAGLEHLRAGGAADDPRARAHLRPLPEVQLGRALVGQATSCIDVSDGLGIDLSRLCRASGLGAVVERLDDAIDRAADADGQGRARALGGGDDYALLFTLPAGGSPPGVTGRGPFIRLGVMRAEPGMVERTVDGERPLEVSGFQHFG